MLQCLIQNHTRFSLIEQAQIAIKAGCTWLVVNPLAPSSAADEIDRLVQLCKENQVMLSSLNDAEAARAHGFHGVVYVENIADTPAALRQELGPEAIIGYHITDASRLPQLQRADIDFATVVIADNQAAEAFSRELLKVRQAECMVPVVAYGNYGADFLPTLFTAGVNGFLTGSFFDMPNPEAAICEFIDKAQALTING